MATAWKKGTYSRQVAALYGKDVAKRARIMTQKAWKIHFALLQEHHDEAPSADVFITPERDIAFTCPPEDREHVTAWFRKYAEQALLQATGKPLQAVIKTVQ